MGKIREIPWPRVFAESAAIVISILLAFGIQAWWEERVERNDESEQLQRLRTEFVTNIDRIDVRDYEEGILKRALRFSI